MSHLLEYDHTSNDDYESNLDPVTNSKLKSRENKKNAKPRRHVKPKKVVSNTQTTKTQNEIVESDSYSDFVSNQKFKLIESVKYPKKNFTDIIFKDDIDYDYDYIFDEIKSFDNRIAEPIDNEKLSSNEYPSDIDHDSHFKEENFDIKDNILDSDRFIDEFLKVPSKKTEKVSKNTELDDILSDISAFLSEKRSESPSKPNEHKSNKLNDANNQSNLDEPTSQTVEYYQSTFNASPKTEPQQTNNHHMHRKPKRKRSEPENETNLRIKSPVNINKDANADNLKLIENKSDQIQPENHQHKHRNRKRKHIDIEG